MSDTQALGFLDLSAELRNEIYELSFQHPGPVWLVGDSKRETKGSSTSSKRYGVPGVRALQNHLLRDTVAFLRVNRQIHAEATPVLYGINQFEAGHPGIICYFAKQIGPSLGFLRHFIISHCTKSSLRQMLGPMKTATRLQRLQIRVSAKYSIGDAATMAKGLLPWARAFHKMRNTGDMQDRRDVLDVLEFIARQWVDVDAKALDAVFAVSYSAEVKANLRQKLKD
ncbi:hypothetical protein PRZ48_011601 [Zasmidium cellare]|uniref:Uncharacterized protein n=1 Tax=Zasmidium cellare TaxID=395010 RepID=A0ABR0E7G5_ZASCE|nr:hypothetical protein PRZ48_011601 [Zasmidium cellare]